VERVVDEGGGFHLVINQRGGGLFVTFYDTMSPLESILGRLSFCICCIQLPSYLVLIVLNCITPVR